MSEPPRVKQLKSNRHHDHLLSIFFVMIATLVFSGEVSGALGFW